MHQTNDEELLEIYLERLHHVVRSAHQLHVAADLHELRDAMSLELEGIGASLMSEDGYTTIKKIVPGGPAAKDGRIKIDDKIIGVGQGEEGEIVNVVDMKLNDVVDTDPRQAEHHRAPGSRARQRFGKDDL